MCGRYILYGPTTRIAKDFGLSEELNDKVDPGTVFRNLEAGYGYNIPPTTRVVIIRSSEGKREPRHVRWGLKQTGVHVVRSDSVDKRWGKSLLMGQRCIMPANGFYEWQQVGKKKLPWLIRPTDPEAMWGFAAVIGNWEGEGVAMFTVDANLVVGRIHDRMPVILRKEDYATWLDPNASFETLTGLLRQYPDDLMTAHRVNRAVSNARNDGPDLMRPADDDLLGDAV